MPKAKEVPHHQKGLTSKQLSAITTAHELLNPGDALEIPDFVQRMKDRLGDDETIVMLPGLDAAIIGECDCAGLENVLVYSRPRIVKILMIRDGMSKIEAEEYIDFNFAQIRGAPILISS